MTKKTLAASVALAAVIASAVTFYTQREAVCRLAFSEIDCAVAAGNRALADTDSVLDAIRAASRHPAADLEI